jgi:hypothetical protein
LGEALLGTDEWQRMKRERDHRAALRWAEIAGNA